MSGDLARNTLGEPTGAHDQTAYSEPPVERSLSPAQQFTAPPYSIAVLVGAGP